jgi:hypothetical protein
MGSRLYHIRWATDANAVKLDSDYNCFYPVTGNLFSYRGTEKDFTGWQSNIWAGSTFDPHSITTEPTFVNSSGGFLSAIDYFPAPGSPVIGAGVDVGLSDVGYSGSPDIGPFEYR